MVGDQAIKYHLINRDRLRQKSVILQTPVEIDLRARSDIVFAASTKTLGQSNVDIIQDLGFDHPISGLSNNLRYFAVAIVG